MVKGVARRTQQMQTERMGLEIVSCERLVGARMRIALRDVFHTWPLKLAVAWPEDARILKRHVLNSVTPHEDDYLRRALGLWYPREMPKEATVETRLTQNDCRVEFLLGDLDKATDEFLVQPEVDAKYILARIEGDVEINACEKFLGYAPVYPTVVLYTVKGWVTYLVLKLLIVTWPAEVPLMDGKCYTDDDARLVMLGRQLRGVMKDYVDYWYQN